MTNITPANRVADRMGQPDTLISKPNTQSRVKSPNVSNVNCLLADSRLHENKSCGGGVVLYFGGSYKQWLTQRVLYCYSLKIVLL